MGAVYLAEDPLIGRLLAIKGIRFDAYADDEEIRRLQNRFDQEIQIAGTFSHPNIVTLYDVGRQGGRSFIAMEFVDGRNLRAELQAHGPLPAERAVELMAPICRALTYAHERKIIHRDVKPTNILVSADGVPKITDFGVARLFGSTLTHAGKIFGTPAYMSPEQARGATLTGASDQFAAAAVLYELLTGERPFKGSSPTAVIYEVIESEPTPPHELAPLVPTAVSAAVMRGMSKAPDQRFESCDALADALEAAVAWSKANPALAYFDTDNEDVAAAAGAGERVFEHSAVLESLWKRASRAAELAVTADVWSGVRSAVLRATRDSRNRAMLAAAALSLITLVSVVAWAASTGGPTARLIPRAEQADLMTDAGGSDRGAPATGIPRRAGDDATAAAGASAEEPASTAPVETSSLRGTFVVASRPQGARVTFDGEVLEESAPVSIQVADDQRHTLRLEAEGYVPLTWSFSRHQLSAAHLETGELYFPLQPLATEAVEVEEGLETSEPATADGEGPDEPATASAAAESDWLGYGVSGPPPSPANIRRLRAPGQTPAPEKIRHVDLALPANAVADGVVVLEIEVSARGNVVQARVLRGLDPVVDQAALNAVVRWKYRPMALSGGPVHVVMTVTLPVRRSNGG